MDKKIFKQKLLDELYKPYRECPSCLVKSLGCTKVVCGEGDPDALVMFIGEAPGKEEDEQGRPFVGRSGKLLTVCLQRAHLKREDVFITNLVKCRPPNNRVPLPQEVEAFKPLLLQEIKIVRPKIICTLGASALQGLLDKTVSITKIRGTHLDYQGIPLIPTYHPAYVLRNPDAEKDLQHDISTIAEYIKKFKTESK
jgi:uracil-DNA glycosylase